MNPQPVYNITTYGEASLSTSCNAAGGEVILIFGAGKSATCLIDYMIKEAGSNNWQVTVVDSDLALAKLKAGDHAHVLAVSINVENAVERSALIQTATIVISLLPPALHFLIAEDCVLLKKNLLTASYADDRIKSMQHAIEKNKLLFLCEMGLDPGIDHMSAMQLIHRIKAEGGNITSFVSHCGGLVAPESDDNPWHYKISWNPRNIVMAGKAGAVYLENNTIKKMPYEKLFDENRLTNVPGIGPLAWYPNRDSLDYIPVYGLQNTATFIRTTLRYQPFCYGWKNLIALKLTDETIFYETDGMTLQHFFKTHIHQTGFTGLLETETQDPDTLVGQLNFLGLHDDITMINKGRCSAMDVLQLALEKKLVLQEDDKDMIVMLHEIGYLQAGKNLLVRTNLIVKGDNNRRTAMAKTVGLPLGIAAKLILQRKITAKGLHIPVIPAIYEPVLEELERHGIAFDENTITL